MADNKINVGGRLHSIATGNVLAGADEILDDSKNKKQNVINAEVDIALADRYTKEETYNKNELDSLITTPDVQYVTVTATDQTTAVTDVLPAIGLANTVYRVGSWDGSQYDVTKYSEYAWNGKDYVHLSIKTGETSAASDVTYDHNDSKLDATNVQQAIDEVRKKSNYNDGENIIDFNTIHLITDNPEYICVAVDADEKILYGIKTDGQPYFGVGCPQQVKDYVNEQINKILGTDDISSTIDSLKEIESFLKDFTNSDTLKKLLDLKANVDEVRATTDDIYKKSNPNDSEGNVVDTNTIFSIKDNPEYIKALTDSVGKLIEAIGIDGIRRFFAGINVQGTLQCTTDNPEYIAVWLDNQNRIVLGFKIDGDPYFGYGVPSQINSLVEALKSSTEKRIDALQQSIDNNILALDYNSDTGELYSLTGETSTINASIDDNGDVYLEQEII